jgi:hypothetical protein
VAAAGRLLMGRDASSELEHMPESVLRKPERCSLVDLAVGAASVQVTKYLLEFHELKPSFETLKMAISGGNVELIRVVLGRLPEAALETRAELLEVAADFHQVETLAWLFRDATMLEREVLFAFALEHHLADAVLALLREGFRPWWGRSRELAANWRPARGIEFGPVPKGLEATAGWWTDAGWKISVLRAGPKLPRNRALVASATLPPGITRLDDSAFEGCSELKLLTIPSEVVTIGHRAFYGCAGLTELSLHSRITSIDGGCFGNCTGLTKLALPPGITSIAAFAFCDCSGLSRIALPPGVTTIEDYAFADCSGLVELTLPPGVTTIGIGAFQFCSGLNQLSLPPGVTTIGSGAFQFCSGLTQLTLPPGITSIGVRVFCHCSNLRQVLIPSGVTKVEYGAFAGWASLRRLSLPSGVTSIEARAFDGCLRFRRD